VRDTSGNTGGITMSWQSILKVDDKREDFIYGNHYAEVNLYNKVIEALSPLKSLAIFDKPPFESGEEEFEDIADRLNEDKERYLNNPTYDNTTYHLSYLFRKLRDLKGEVIDLDYSQDDEPLVKKALTEISLVFSQIKEIEEEVVKKRNSRMSMWNMRKGKN
tara:strand:+ start:1703 stop:2188 length:486 start_codon:yes stop_codon:yes gene_type:complete